MIACLAGCQNRPIGRVDDLPYPRVTGRPNSIVFASPKLRKPNKAMPVYHYFNEPWYASRKDRSPTVYSGVQTARVEETSTYTRERLEQHGSRVHDNIYIRTYRSSYSQSVR